MWIDLAVTLVALLVFLGVSQPLEVRSGRWWRIAISLAIVWSISGMFRQGPGPHLIGAIVLLPVLAFVWMGNLAYFSSKWIVDSLLGFGVSKRSLGGFRPDFRVARSLGRDGRLDEAIQLTQDELTKDPHNFEGLLLLATLYHEKGLFDQAMDQLAIIARNPAATVDQKKIAKDGLKQCLEAKAAKQV